MLKTVAKDADITELARRKGSIDPEHLPPWIEIAISYQRVGLLNMWENHVQSKGVGSRM